MSSRQELYYFMLDVFYGLDATDRLPAWYVIREFLQAYLCEYYCMYAQQESTCDYCKETHLKCTCDRCIANAHKIRDHAPRRPHLVASL